MHWCPWYALDPQFGRPEDSPTTKPTPCCLSTFVVQGHATPPRPGAAGISVESCGTDAASSTTETSHLWGLPAAAAGYQLLIAAAGPHPPLPALSSHQPQHSRLGAPHHTQHPLTLHSDQLEQWSSKQATKQPTPHNTNHTTTLTHPPLLPSPPHPLSTLNLTRQYRPTHISGFRQVLANHTGALRRNVSS